MVNSNICRKCGTVNAPGSQYCDQCSAPLQGPVATTTPLRAAPSPASRPSRRPAPQPIVSVAADPPPPPPTPPLKGEGLGVGATPPVPPLQGGGSVTVAASPTPPPAQPQSSETMPLTAAVAAPAAPTVRVMPTPSPVAGSARRGLPSAMLLGGALLVALLGIALGAALTGAGGTPTPVAASATVGSSSAATARPGATLPANATLPASATLPAVAGATPVPTATFAAGLPTATLDPHDGTGLLAAGQWAAALTVFSTTLATAPHDPTALLGRGQALTGLRRYGEAANALTEALAVRGLTDGPTLLARAQANVGQQSWQAVLQDTDTMLKANATDLTAQLLRAQAHAGTGDNDAAAADYAAALAAHPQDARIYVARAGVYVNYNKKAEAISDLKQATTLAPNDVAGWLALGRAYLIYDAAVPTDPEPALAAFNRAVEINPQLAMAYYERANLYYNHKGDTDHALADINQAISHGPVTAEMYRLRANIEGGLDNAAAQLADLNGAIAVAPQDDAPYWWRTDYYYRHGQYDKAVADMSQVIAQSNDANAYGQRSLLYLLQADYAHAGSDAAEVLRQLPDRAAGYYAQAQIVFSQGDYPAALDRVNKALDRAQPYEKTNIQAVRGRIYVRLKQPGPAKADLDAVLASEKSNNIGLLGQAELALAQGQTAAAGTALDTCVDNNGGFGACYVARAAQEAKRGATDPARADLAEARKRVLFPDEQRAADALAAQLK